MCEFSNKLVTSGRKFQKKNHFWKINEKVIFWENSSEKHFFLKNPRWNFSFSKNQLKNMFFCLENASKKESRESLAKVSLKLSLAIRKFHETFGGQMEVSWNFRWPDESFMKLSVARWKFHETFVWRAKVSWNFRMATESFSETFAKLSSNFCMSLFSMHFLGKKIMLFSCFFSKKWEIALAPWILSKKMFSLEFSSKNDFFLDLSKRCFLFYWNFLPEVN